MSDINRQLHEALGRCLHDFEGKSYEEWHIMVCKKCHFETQGLEAQFPVLWIPDYYSDPRLVIEAMPMEFLESIFCIDAVDYFARRPGKRLIVFDAFIDLVMDDTGKLAKLAIEFLKGEER